MNDLILPKSVIAIARAGMGVDNIPYNKLREQGTVVFNTPGANANAVKELVILGILLASRDVIGGINYIKENAQDPLISVKLEKDKNRFVGREILGRTIGVIGLGAIGGKVALSMEKLGMKVLGYDSNLSVKMALQIGTAVTLVSSLEEIYKNSDYITIHVPLNDYTRNMINKETIAVMKDEVVILNFARDALVCDKDLLNALDSGKVFKYVTDLPTYEIAGHEKVIPIPHLGASTKDSEENCAIMAVEELKEFTEKGNIVNSVNFNPCIAMQRTIKNRITLFYRKGNKVIDMINSIADTISIMTSESDNIIYSIIDTKEKISLENLHKIEKECIRVRVIH
jgi:D-3-phosphoglycerate dehydrogenase